MTASTLSTRAAKRFGAQDLRAQVSRTVGQLRDLSAPVVSVVRAAYTATTVTGRVTLATGLVAWLLGWRLGWVELAMVSAACVAAFVLSIGFVLRAPDVSATVSLRSVRVPVGAQAEGDINVRNNSSRRLMPLQVELAVPGHPQAYDVPWLPGRGKQENTFKFPTVRRGVIEVGPPTAVQGDPLGLLRRMRAVGPAVELCVYPEVIRVPVVGAGVLRDLGSDPTRRLSQSDLEFHTLRDYVRGDDRRHIHWRSSARAGRKLVRQYLDTRRARVTIAVDADRGSYGDEDDFELAMSVVGSLGLQCLKEDLDVTLVAGDHAATPGSRNRMLDLLARAELGGPDRGLAKAAGKAAALAPDTTYALLVTGNVLSFGDVRTAASRFAPDVVPVAVRIEPDLPTHLASKGSMPVLAVSELKDLPGALRGVT